MSIYPRKIEVAPRPFIITFYYGDWAEGKSEVGGRYTMTSADVQRLLDEYPVLNVTPNRLELNGEGEVWSRIEPATLGGGFAFTITEAS